MSGKKLIAAIIDEAEAKYKDNKKYGCAAWTEFMGVAIDNVAKKMSLTITRKRLDCNEDSGENLNIDVMLFDKAAWKELYKRNSYYDAFILPKAVIELENSDNKERLAYCLWKLLCIRSPLRILSCYQSNDLKITKLKMYLKDVVVKGKLKANDMGELFVIVGNEEAEKDSAEKYWHVYAITMFFPASMMLLLSPSELLYKPYPTSLKNRLN